MRPQGPRRLLCKFTGDCEVLKELGREVPAPTVTQARRALARLAWGFAGLSHPEDPLMTRCAT